MDIDGINRKVGILGVGHFGSAIAKGMLKRNFCEPESLWLVSRCDSHRGESSFEKSRVVSSLEEIAEHLDLLLICVRSQDLAELKIHKKLAESCLLVSVIAGVSQQVIEQKFATSSVVRMMPNIAAYLGQGMIVYQDNPSLEVTQRRNLQALIEHWGVGLAVSQERLIDVATAVSGSGPGLLYWLLKEFVEIAQKSGFSLEQAELITRQMAVGSMTVWDESDKKLTQLVKDVASKGGTTQAAIDQLQSLKVDQAIKDSLQAAIERAMELGGIQKIK